MIHISHIRAKPDLIWVIGQNPASWAGRRLAIVFTAPSEPYTLLQAFSAGAYSEDTTSQTVRELITAFNNYLGDLL